MQASPKQANPLGIAGLYLTQPARLLHTYSWSNLRPDLLAGLTLAVVLLPQAIAFALIADLPPRMGLYTAVVGAFVGALWGASHQMLTGPTNTLSLLVFATLSDVARTDAEFIVGAGMVAVMVGLFQLVMGLARLGIVVNYVSHSVVVGFSTGAGLLIGINQLAPLLGLPAPAGGLLSRLVQMAGSLDQMHLPTALIGVGAIVVVVVARRISARLPEALLAVALGTAAVFALDLGADGVRTIGNLPSNLPPLAPLPLFDIDLIARLSTGALAIGAIGLVQTSAISRSFASRTGQRLDSNQEFVGQGLANIAVGLFSGYPAAGSFSLSAVNFGAGARSPFAAIFAAIIVLVAMILLAPLGAHVPTAALSGILMVVAYRLLDFREIRRILGGNRSDSVIMAATLLGTLFLKLEFAVLLGILLSFAAYIRHTSLPRVYFVLPDEQFRHFVPAGDEGPCPQMGVLEIHGDLYFGAVHHVEEIVQDHVDAHPDERYLLIRMHSVNQIDFSGIHTLENILRLYRERGGDVYFVRVHEPVREVMDVTGFSEALGASQFLDDDSAISHLFYRVLDPAVCIYECPFRAFRECQNLPKHEFPQELPTEVALPAGVLELITPRALYGALRREDGPLPLVIDVREPSEYRRGHIPQATLRPLVDFAGEDADVPADGSFVLVCRTGRRSRRAAAMLHERGHTRIGILDGGMLAWESAGLLEAVDLFGHGTQGDYYGAQRADA